MHARSSRSRARLVASRAVDLSGARCVHTSTPGAGCETTVRAVVAAAGAAT